MGIMNVMNAEEIGVLHIRGASWDRMDRNGMNRWTLRIAETVADQYLRIQRGGYCHPNQDIFVNRMRKHCVIDAEIDHILVPVGRVPLLTPNR